MEQLRNAAERRAVTFIAGEAGVGKSRMGREAALLADNMGLSHFMGSCTADPTVPYAPFVTAVRRRCRSLSDDEMRSLFSGSAMLAANLLPEVAGVTGPELRTPNQEDLFAAVWQLLHRLSGPEGGLLLLEDLHWADADSLRLLAYLIREIDGLGMWIVGTYRSDEMHRRHPLAVVLSDLGRERRYEEITLRPLDDEGLREMVSAIFDGTPVGDDFVAALRGRTSGNPFFIEELMKVLLDDGSIYRGPGEWERRDIAEMAMPLSVRETLLLRARNLDGPIVEALQLAAVLGERIEPDVLAAVTGMSAPQVEHLIGEGLRLQLISERRDGPRATYRFRHALTREAFADELVGPARRHAHRRIAEALRSLHEDDLDSIASELAEHFEQAGDVVAAVEFGLRAARRAVASTALTEAAARYDRVLHFMEGDPMRLDVLVEAAEALQHDNVLLAKAFATEALDTARAAGDALAQSRALSVLEHEVWRSGDSREAIRLASEAYAIARGIDDRHEAFMVARLSRLLTLGDRYDEAAELIAVGIPLAEHAGSDRALSIMHGTRMLRLTIGPDFYEAMQLSVDAARRAGDLLLEAVTAINAGYMCIWNGALAPAREYLTRGIELRERAAPNDQYASAGLAWLLSLTGELAEARRIATPLAASDDIPTSIVALNALCELGAREEDPDLAELVDRFWTAAARTGEAQRTVPALAARAALALRDGIDVATPIFMEALEATANKHAGGSHWMFSPDLARALAEEGRRDELDDWYRKVNQLSIVDPNPHNRAADDLCLGYLLMAGNENSAAVERLAEARAAYKNMPCPSREAEALLAMSNLLWRSDRVVDSLNVARDAGGIADRIGAVALSRRAAELVKVAETPSVLVTVMFTDIVGSTERLSALGDRAWKSVLERHNSLVRRELLRWNGREIDFTGDGFLAAFDSPTSGVRCALAVRDSLAAAGIQIRVGLHTGECQVNGANLAGLAVHIAARVNALAGPGEVLVSGTVHDVLIGSALSFADRGTHELKGVPGLWRLAAVSAP